MATPLRLRSTALVPVLLAVAVVAAPGCFTPASAPSSSGATRAVTEPSGESRPRTASASAEDRALVRAVAGEWRLVDEDAEARIDSAVSQVTESMNVLVRGIANGRIDEAVNPDQRVMIEADGDGHIVVAVGGGRPVRLGLNGRSVRTTNADDQPIRVRATIRDGRLTIEEATDQGRRSLQFQPRGGSLIVSTRIQSDRLPANIVYRLRYQRRGAQEIARR